MTLASFDQLDLAEAEDAAEHFGTIQLLLQHVLKQAVALSENADEDKRKKADAYRQAITETGDALLRFAAGEEICGARFSLFFMRVDSQLFVFSQKNSQEKGGIRHSVTRQSHFMDWPTDGTLHFPSA